MPLEMKKKNLGEGGRGRGAWVEGGELAVFQFIKMKKYFN